MSTALGLSLLARAANTEAVQAAHSNQKLNELDCVTRLFESDPAMNIIIQITFQTGGAGVVVDHHGRGVPVVNGESRKPP